VLLRRCLHVDFVDKVRRAEAAGAVAVVVVNNKPVPAVHTMGWGPAAQREAPPGVPAVMVPLVEGEAMAEALQRGEPLVCTLSGSPHLGRFRGGHREARAAACAAARAATPQASPLDPRPWLPFVPVTQPAAFAWPAEGGSPEAEGGRRAYFPAVGEIPPVAVQRAAGWEET